MERKTVETIHEKIEEKSEVKQSKVEGLDREIPDTESGMQLQMH